MEKLGKELTATILASRWKVRVLHALYREDGKFYTPLKRVPGALFDHNGYIVFPTWESYLSSPYLRHGPRVNVRGAGISEMPGYIKARSEAAIDSN